LISIIDVPQSAPSAFISGKGVLGEIWIVQSGAIIDFSPSLKINIFKKNYNTLFIRFFPKPNYYRKKPFISDSLIFKNNFDIIVLK
jgi:hypothetical protein